MLLTFLSYLLYTNGLTNRPDSSIIYSRVGITIILYSFISAYTSFHITYLEKGVGLYGGLFNITAVTHSFQIFIFIISSLILLMSAFYPRKRYIEEGDNVLNNLSKSATEYVSIINKMSEQFTISGATLLISSGDLGSIYLCIELQSFSLYIISSLHRNSESSTGSALTYFLLGGLSSCFILLGIGLIYANSGLTNLDGIYSVISDSEKYAYYSA